METSYGPNTQGQQGRTVATVVAVPTTDDQPTLTPGVGFLPEWKNVFGEPLEKMKILVDMAEVKAIELQETIV